MTNTGLLKTSQLWPKIETPPYGVAIDSLLRRVSAVAFKHFYQTGNPLGSIEPRSIEKSHVHFAADG